MVLGSIFQVPSKGLCAIASTDSDNKHATNTNLLIMIVLRGFLGVREAYPDRDSETQTDLLYT
jgi:hypothetical protein